MTPRPEVHVRTRAQLAEAGYGRRAIERLVRDGDLLLLARGVYGTALTPDRVVRALRRGHRVTCVDALRLHGVWTPPSTGDHDAGLRAGQHYGYQIPGVLLHDPPLRAWDDPHPVLPLPRCLEHAVHCLDADDAAIVVESCLHLRLVDAATVREVTRSLSQRRRQALFPLRADAESGTETVVRRALARRRVSVRAQVYLEGIGRVDLLVGERLIIECDSVAHHTEATSYHRDRHRDLAARQRGFVVVRLTWEQVMLDREATIAALLAIVRAGDHRAPRVRKDNRAAAH